MNEIIYTFFQINLLIILSYFVVLLLEKFKIDSISINKFNKLLVALVLLWPLLSLFIPYFSFINTTTPLGLMDLHFDKNISIQEVANTFSKSNISSINITIILFVLYLIGVSIGLIFFIKNILSLIKIINSSVIIKKHRTAIVLSTSCINTPFSFQLLNKAYVIIPEFVLVNPILLKISLNHEAYHHRHGDTTTAYLIQLIKIVFFINPFIYLLKNKLHQIQELACDESIIHKKVASPLDYSSCLVAVANKLVKSDLIPNCVVSMAKTNNEKILKRRIEMIFKNEQPKIKLAKKLLIFGTLLSLLITICHATIRSSNNNNNSNRDFYYPLKQFRISSSYGIRISKYTKKKKMHGGIDLASKKGSLIHALSSGVVTFAGHKNGFDNIVTIDHGNDLQSIYAHIGKKLVKKGEKVSANQVIGKLITDKDEVWLHFEIRKKEKSVNPEEYLANFRKK